MPETRTISRAARDLQAAANRLALMTRNHNRDVILAGLFADVSKGRRAAARVEAQAPVLAALEDEVRGLRTELGAMLDAVLPDPQVLPDLPEMTEPTKRKKRK